MFRIALFFAAVISVYGQTTNVDRCLNNAGALPSNVHIVGCSSPPCVLPQLQNAVVNVDFTPDHPVQSMRTLATAFINFGPITLPIAYDLGQYAQTCNFLKDDSCPTAAGRTLRFTMELPIEAFFPEGVHLRVEFRVVDENNGPLFCFSVPLVIASPLIN